MMDMIAIKLDPELKRELMEIAVSKDRTVSQILRGLIKVYVESHKIKSAAKLFQDLDI